MKCFFEVYFASFGSIKDHQKKNLANGSSQPQKL